MLDDQRSDQEVEQEAQMTPNWTTTRVLLWAIGLCALLIVGLLAWEWKTVFDAIAGNTISTTCKAWNLKAGGNLVVYAIRWFGICVFAFCWYFSKHVQEL